MIIFAWILWIYILICIITTVISIIKCNVMYERYTIHLGYTILMIATFVFMSIYIFAR